jgi:ABC-2 type transport system permease protein
VGDLLAYRSFVKNLVLKDLKLKYRDSVLGFVWSLANPLFMIVVFTFAFRYVMRVHTENYGYFLMVGLLPWNFFAGSVQSSTGAIIGNAGLIRQVSFPRETLPIAAVLFNFAQLLLALAVFLPAFLVFSTVPVRWTMLLVVPLLLLHLGLAVGAAFALSALTVSYRDIAHFTELALFFLFWTTPIVYSAATAPPEIQLFLKLNPTAAFATAYQDVLLEGRIPDALNAVSVVGSTAVALFLGHAVFRRYRATLAEEV